MGSTTRLASAPTSRGLRRDIQGLRALAVLIVVANHLIDWPLGGFVGVDVFFVISGFLISDLLLRERDRTGRISYLGFYRRRFRRIIPASVTVLIATVGTSYYLYQPLRAGIVRDDAIWSFLFVSNWHFAAAGTDYFNNENLTSPLQHFWSLAVEEQYYLAWPVIVIGLGFLAGKKLSRRRTLAVVLAVLVGASFAFALWESISEPTSAYFSTFSRAWELGIGALLAVSSGRLHRIPTVLQPVLSWIGLAGIGLSLVLIGPTSSFPAPWAALPVLSTALVIVAGMGGRSRLLYPLTNPVSQYIGNVSYSLYLWHFPVIVLMTAYFPEPGSIRTVGIMVVMASLTVIGFHFVEDPIRRSTWLEPGVPRRRRVRYKDSFEPELLRRLGYSALTLAAVVTVTFTGYVLVRPSPAVADYAVPLATTSTAAATGPKTVAEQVTASIDASLAATTFPILNPAVDDLPDNRAPQWTENGCGTTNASNVALCVYGPKDAKKTAAVFGDSIALSWLPGLILALGEHGYRVHSFVAGQCPAADVQVAMVGRNTVNNDCIEHRAWALQAIAELQPDLVVLSDSNQLMNGLVSRATGDAVIAEWTAAATRTWAALPATTKSYVLTPPPGSQNLLNCMTVRAKPEVCARSLTTQPSYLSLQRAEQAAAKATGVEYIDTSSWFCGSRVNLCPAFVGTTPVYVDGTHLTRQYSSYLAPMLAQALQL